MVDHKRPLLDHLEELRKRIWRVLFFLLVFFIGVFPFTPYIIDWFGAYAGGFVFIRPYEAFLVRLKVSFYASILLTCPVIIFEVWRFVGLGLSKEEKQRVLMFLPLSFLLFVLGLSLAWVVVMPVAIKFFLSFGSEQVQPFLSVDAFVSFAFWLGVAFGGMFEVPLFLLLLVKIGILRAETLSKGRPYAIVGLAILAAFLTPGPDFFSQIALLLPTYLLYELAVLLARGIDR